MNSGRESRRGRSTSSQMRTPIVVLLAVATLLCWVLPGFAGSVSLRWDAIPDADVAGYRLYHGNSPGDLNEMIDVGNATSTTLSGLEDCAWWYISIRAYDAGGLESPDDSNLVYGLPRPVVQSLDRTRIGRGQTLDFVVSGLNFDQGAAGDPNHPPARVDLSHSGLSVTATEVIACDTIRITVQAASDAALGFADLAVENPDLTWDSPVTSPWVFGLLDNAIEVTENSDSSAPEVSSTEPGAGAVEIPATVNPRVIFTEAMSPSTVNRNTVRLVGSDGLAITQEAGWPLLEGSVVTLRPELPLAEGETYRIHVLGGPGGVRDLNGNSMLEDFVQTPGFTVMGSTRSDDAEGPRVVYAFPESGQVDISRNLQEVLITFDRDMSGLAGLLSPAEMQERFGVMQDETPVRQAANSPRFDSGGRTVAIILAESLRDNYTYATFVHLDGAALRSTLEGADRMDLFMGGIWTSRPAWRVEGALERIAYLHPETDQRVDLQASAESVPASNSGVPVQATFEVSFSRPVVQSSANASVFQLLFTTERRYQRAQLVEPMKLTNGGKTVVVETVGDLPAGAWGVLRVMTGPQGVQLHGESGPFALPTGTYISVPFATEVAPSTQSETLGVAE